MPTNDNNRIGNNIRALRRMAGYTQQQFANVLNCSDSLISEYERGTKPVTREFAELIADHFNITVDSLLNSEYKPNQLNLIPGSIKERIDFIKQEFPLLSPKEAMKNRDFKIAYDSFLTFYDYLEKNEMPHDKIIDDIKSGFEKSADDNVLKDENINWRSTMKKNQLDISELIDPIEEKLFRRCVDILYPELNFRYLTKEDIRKADIKERLTTPSSWVSGAVLRKNAVRISLCISSRADIRIPVYDSLGLYIMIVKKYFEILLARCKAGSREFRYVELAIDRLGGEDLSISDMDDMYIIMMSAYRTLFESNARVQYEFEPMVLSFDEESALYGKLVRSTYFRQAMLYL